MDWDSVLTKDQITVNLTGSSKEEVIGSLLDLLMTTGKVIDRQAALASILEREEKMSTGIEDGVAIPHGKSSAVSEMVACVGVAPGGIDFDAQDGKPSRIFVLTLSPANQSGPHIRFLAWISSLLADGKIRERILTAGSREAVLELLRG